MLQVAWNYGANFGGKTGNNSNWTGGADTIGMGAATVSSKHTICPRENISSTWCAFYQLSAAVLCGGVPAVLSGALMQFCFGVVRWYKM